MSRMAIITNQSTEASAERSGLFGVEEALMAARGSGRFPLDFIYIEDEGRFVGIWLDSLAAEEIDFEDIFTAHTIDTIRFVADHFTEEIVTKFDGFEVSSTLKAIKAIKETQGDSNYLTWALLNHAIRKQPGPEKERARLLFSRMIDWPEGLEGIMEKLLNAVEWSAEECPPTLLAYQQAAALLKAFAVADLAPTGAGFCPDGGIGLAWSDARVCADVECYNDGTSEFSFRRRGGDVVFLPVNAFKENDVQGAVERVKQLHAG